MATREQGTAATRSAQAQAPAPAPPPETGAAAASTSTSSSAAAVGALARLQRLRGGGAGGGGARVVDEVTRLLDGPAARQLREFLGGVRLDGGLTTTQRNDRFQA